MAASEGVDSQPGDSRQPGNYRPGTILKRGEGEKLEAFRMRGRVTADDKQPIEGAEILVCQSMNPQDCAGSPWRAVSGNDGFYELRLPLKRDAHFAIRVSSEGFATLEGRLSMEAPADLERNFVLSPAVAWLRGRVVDPAGVPVEGASVMVSPRNRRPDVAGSRGIGVALIGGKRERLVTDRNGEFGADGFQLGSVAVVAFAQKYRAAAQEVALDPGENRVDLRLLPARTLSIKVLNSRGQPVEAATALCRAPGERGGVEMETPRPGVVTLKLDPQIDQCRCELRAPSYLSEVVSFSTGSPPAEVILEDGPVVRGQVVNQSGAPIEGAKVSVQWSREEREFEGGFGTGGNTDSTGHFAIPVSTDQSVNVVVSAQGYLDSRVSIEAPNQPERTIILKRPEGALNGRVVDPSGNPVTEFQVTVMAIPTAPAPRQRGRGVRPEFSTSGMFQHREGWFSFPELPSGDLEIYVSTRGRRGMRKSQVVHLPQGMTAELLVQLEPAEERN